MIQSFATIFCTVPDQATAEKISLNLVSSHLAACCNIVSGVESVYYWEGKVCRDGELLLIIKSTQDKFEKIKEKIIELHPYEVPEVIALPIINGNESYLKWIEDLVNGR